MQDMLATRTPSKLFSGEWHLPFIDADDAAWVEDLKKI